MSFIGETDAVDCFGQRGVAVAGFSVGDDDVIGGPAEFTSEAICSGGEGVLVVGVGGDNQELRAGGFGQQLPGKQSLGHGEEERLPRHKAPPETLTAKLMISRATSRIGMRRRRLAKRIWR